MSRLDELIAELCPDGVEYRILEECCNVLDNKRKPVTKAARVAGDYPYYGANGIQDYVSEFIFDGTFVLVGEDGSVITPYGRPVVNWAQGKIWVNNHAHIIEEKEGILLRFIFHYLQTIDISSFIHGNIPKFTGKDFKMLKLPVPPLEVQREIVRILDSFTLLTAELTAELTARKKQYEYYLDYLLMNAQQTQLVKLKDICRFYNGDRGKNYPKVSEMVPEGIPFINAGDINGRVDYDGCNKITQEKYMSMGGAKLLPGDILYCLRGSTGKNGINERTGGTVASSLVAIRANERVNYKYLYYLLNSSMEKRQRIRSDTGAVQPNLSAQNVGEFEFSLPLLHEQERIVSILDNFEGINTDIRRGLPAEIEARQKQYEYYRDRLLTFKEKTA